MDSLCALEVFWMRHRTPYETAHRVGDVVEMRMEFGGRILFQKYKLQGLDRSYEGGRCWLIEEWRIVYE